MNGKDLGADLFQLYVVGHEDLPAVAAEYGTAVTSLSRAGELAAGAMSRPPLFGPDRVCRAWLDLLLTLEGILRENEDALTDTGRALVMAADHYAATDREAAAEFGRLRAAHPGPSAMTLSRGDTA